MIQRYYLQISEYYLRVFFTDCTNSFMIDQSAKFKQKWLSDKTPLLKYIKNNCNSACSLITRFIVQFYFTISLFIENLDFITKLVFLNLFVLRKPEKHPRNPSLITLHNKNPCQCYQLTPLYLNNKNKICYRIALLIEKVCS